MRSLNVVLSWVIRWSMMALQLKNEEHDAVVRWIIQKYWDKFTRGSNMCQSKDILLDISSSCVCFLSHSGCMLTSAVKVTHTLSSFLLLLTGWRRRNPSGRRCGPWRGRRPPSSRRDACTGTRWGCSIVGCRPGSWGRCEHCQEKQKRIKHAHDRLLLNMKILLSFHVFHHHVKQIWVITK